ncbi:MAG: hypothetical protein NTX50_20285 [Candidatus Sumerlaeota bacterium]|nr:hypothetical protein [Candidatus Sumerlaeota bacterium]
MAKYNVTKEQLDAMVKREQKNWPPERIQAANERRAALERQEALRLQKNLLTSARTARSS